MPKEVVRLTLDLDPDLHEKIRLEALDEGLSVSEVIRQRLKMRRPPKTVFKPPTVEEVEAYAKEKGLKIGAEYFVDFFQQKDWQTGKVKMTDWRAAVRNAARDGWTLKGQRSEEAPKPTEPSGAEEQRAVQREIQEAIRLRKEHGL